MNAKQRRKTRRSRKLWFGLDLEKMLKFFKPKTAVKHIVWYSIACRITHEC